MLDAIDRIRDFALSPPGRRREPASQGVASAAASFGLSRRALKKRRPRPSAPTPSDDDPSEQEMCQIARPYGFVVRIDADAKRENMPSVKLLRFDDRAHPAGTFADFLAAMEWLSRYSPPPA